MNNGFYFESTIFFLTNLLYNVEKMKKKKMNSIKTKNYEISEIITEEMLIG